MDAAAGNPSVKRVLQIGQAIAAVLIAMLALGAWR
jgi:hypothetical protein